MRWEARAEASQSRNKSWMRSQTASGTVSAARSSARYRSSADVLGDVAMLGFCILDRCQKR